MNGSADRSGNGLEARSRKKKLSSSNGGTGKSNGSDDGIYIVSDSGDSRRDAARSDRMAMRKHRVHRSRARKKSVPLNGLAFCLIAGVIFVMYLLVCLILFRNIPDGEAKGMRGLVKKTKEQVERIRGKFRHPKKDLVTSQKGNNVEEIAVPDSPIADTIVLDSSEKIAVPKSPVPVGVWPVSIRDEDGIFEEIKHPGFDEGHDVLMSVPPFWANDPVAIHENKLMSRERALSIGTCITPDPKTGSSTRGDACPVNERTIFVAIASYRDYQCRDTGKFHQINPSNIFCYSLDPRIDFLFSSSFSFIPCYCAVRSAFSAAAHPERIRVGVVDQIVVGEDGSCDVPHSPCSVDPNQPLCLYKNQIDVYQMEANLAVGPVFARHLGHRLYRGEYYYTQSDAHVTFTKGWDVDIISQMEATGDEMAVLSTYLTDIVGSIDPQSGLSLRKTRPIMCNTEYEGGGKEKYLRHLSQPEGAPGIHGMPQLQVSRSLFVILSSRE